MTQFKEQFLKDNGTPFTPELVGEYSVYLVLHCSEYFLKWWNPEKFNWSYSKYLAEYCSEYFLEWWNPEKFKWKYSVYLAAYCSEYTQWKIDGYKLEKLGIEKFSPDEIVKLRLDNFF